VIERYGSYVVQSASEKLAGRLLYLAQLGLLQQLVADKRAARQEWRLQRGLSGSTKAAGQPAFISVADIARASTGQFAGLVQDAEAWLSEDSELVSSSPSFKDFSKVLHGLPAWHCLRADAEAGVAELQQQLRPELLRGMAVATSQHGPD
jgi:hypothetical protein